MTAYIKKKIELSIPPEINKKINNGELKIFGSQVRNKDGTILMNLKSIDAEEDRFYSPSVFMFCQKNIIISDSLISQKLQEKIKGLQKQLCLIDDKLDRIIENQALSIDANIRKFQELFVQLTRKSSLVEPKKIFECGVEVIAKILSGLGGEISKYIDSTTVYYKEIKNGYEQEKQCDYGEYRTIKDFFLSKIFKSEFSPLEKSRVLFYLYAAIHIINCINLLSLVIDKSPWPNLEDNLSQLEQHIETLLITLIKGIGKEGDIINEFYSTDRSGYYQTIEYLPRLVDYYSKKDDNYTIHNLIIRKIPHNVEKSHKERDFNRKQAIYILLNILDDINNLKNRNNEFKNANSLLPELDTYLKKAIENYSV